MHPEHVPANLFCEGQTYLLGPLISTEVFTNYLFLVYFIVLSHHIMMEVIDFTTLPATQLRTKIFKNCR